MKYQSSSRRYLTAEQWNQLISSVCDNRDALLLRFLYETGCSVGEVVHLRREDVDLARCFAIIHSGHTGRKRTVTFSHELAQKLQQHLETVRAKFLFSSRQSESITTKRVRQLFKSYCKKAHIHFASGPQILRYTYVFQALLRNVPLPQIQMQIGLGKSRVSSLLHELRYTENASEIRSNVSLPETLEQRPSQ